MTTETYHWGVEISDAEDGITRVVDYQIRERPARLAAANGLRLLRRTVTERGNSTEYGPWEEVCSNCDGSGMDSTDHGFEGQPAEVHPCGYCREGWLPS